MKTKPLMIIGSTLVMVGWLGCFRWKPSPSGLGAPAVPRPASRPAAALLPQSLKTLPLPKPIPDSIRPIFGREGESFATRLNTVQALGADLSRAELEALFAFLRTTGVRAGARLGGEHVLKNEVMEVLLDQATWPHDLPAVLRALYRDGKQDVVTRDYAVQHLVACCETLGWTPPDANAGTTNFMAAPEIAAARKVLWGALRDTDQSLAGTALLGLHRLPDTDPHLLDAAALRLAQDPTISGLTRVTALQVCAQRGLPQVLPVLRELARTDSSLPARVAAIAAIGDLGDTAEQSFLENLSDEGNRHLRPALRSAQRRLNQRLAKLPAN